MHPDGGKREEDKKLLIFISNAVMRDEIKKSRHREAPLKKRGVRSPPTNHDNKRISRIDHFHFKLASG
jgi:hypothetical protein